MTPWTCVSCVASGRGAFLQLGSTCLKVECQLKSTAGITTSRKRKQTEFFDPAPWVERAATVDGGAAPVVFDDAQWWDEDTLFRAIFEAIGEPFPAPPEFASDDLAEQDIERILADALEVADMLPEPIPEAVQPFLADEGSLHSVEVDTAVEMVKASRQISITFGMLADTMFDLLGDA
jgi:hypothetical protein